MDKLEFGTPYDGATVEVADNNTKGTVFSITSHDMGNNGGYDFDIEEAKLLKKALDTFLMEHI